MEHLEYQEKSQSEKPITITSTLGEFNIVIEHGHLIVYLPHRNDVFFFFPWLGKRLPEGISTYKWRMNGHASFQWPCKRLPQLWPFTSYRYLQNPIYRMYNP